MQSAHPRFTEELAHSRHDDHSGQIDHAGRDELEESGASESIRDLQRRRREVSRVRAMEALLAAPVEEDEENEEEGGEAPRSDPAPAQVFVVFHGAKWNDPDGALRESNAIAGVYATEEAARKAVKALNDHVSEQEDAWYQPYPVQE